MWEAKWQHKSTEVAYTEYSYDLYDLERELNRLKEHGHKIISGPYPKETTAVSFKPTGSINDTSSQ